MKRHAIVLALLVAALLITPLLSGCTDLQQASATTEATTAGATTTATESPSTVAATTTSAPQATTSTTSAPAATTTTTTLGGLHINPGALHTYPGLSKIDPNYLLTPTRYEDTHPFIHWEWETVWKTQTNGACSAGSQKFTSTKNTWAGISFKGTGIQLIASTGANGGRLIAHLSGPGVNRQETIDLDGSPQCQVVVWYSGHLTNADYGVYFEFDNTNPSGRVVWIDAMDVWGTVTPP